MRRLDRNINLAAVFGPFVVLAVVAPLAWETDLLNWSDIAIFSVMSLVAGLGVTVGYDLLRTHRSFRWLVLATFAIPFALGFALTQSLHGALTGLLWGGVIRVFMEHHVTWSINSVCHFFGRRRFNTDDHSTNVFWLAIPSFGESWHHNHHAFPRAAVHGLKWWEIDATGAAIRMMKRMKLAWNVV